MTLENITGLFVSSRASYEGQAVPIHTIDPVHEPALQVSEDQVFGHLWRDEPDKLRLHVLTIIVDALQIPRAPLKAAVAREIKARGLRKEIVLLRAV